MTGRRHGEALRVFDKMVSNSPINDRKRHLIDLSIAQDLNISHSRRKSTQTNRWSEASLR